jgi:hypothetical protein
MTMTVADVIAVVLGIGFGLGGVSKLAGASSMRRNADHLGFRYSTYRLIGGCELAGGIGLLASIWVRPVGVAAAIGLAALMVGAVLCHRRSGDTLATAAPAGVLAVAVLVEGALRAVGP